MEEYINNYGLSEAEYRNALKNEATGEDKKTENNTKDEDWRKDYQLSRAVDLVKALGIYTQGK